MNSNKAQITKAEQEYFNQLMQSLQIAYMVSFIASCEFGNYGKARARQLLDKYTEWQDKASEWADDGVLEVKLDELLKSLGLSSKDFYIESTLQDLNAKAKQLKQQKPSAHEQYQLKQNLVDYAKVAEIMKNGVNIC